MSKAGRWYRYPMPENITQERVNSIQFKMCDIKRPFSSEEEAEARLTKAGLTKSGHRRGSTYKCKLCPYWHISSKKKWIKLANKNIERKQ